MRAAAVLAPVLALASAPPALADTPGQVEVDRTPRSGAVAVETVDRVVVRFTAPETGGREHPRFVLERVLAFETRLQATSEPAHAPSSGYDERDVRSAMDRDLEEQILAGLGRKVIEESPADMRPDPGEVARAVQQVTAALVERFGGRERVDAAAAAEGIGSAEVDALLRRSGFAAWYLDRAVTPILHASEEQLRDVYRTAAHPYRGQPFEQVRAALERWFLVERLAIAETSFLQAARSHVRVVVTQ